ncbi:very short patch repair endonuclease [Herbaspirillum robiniae]|uniref:Very short patch repair endonuclease n=1 Tax=Herbaspirillum robiniae TaxID=2014887 RepID=A0A246WN48_9BURK|nr:DNA mismatch endonuclease Vsr [Herbaspirillum robiniae]OWY26929.1 very short patch repair endonuclease [Herbaspirillum robiniae]
MDIVDSTIRSRMMANIRSKDTKPEMAVRRYLHANGFRYRLHDRQLPGKPDLSLPKYRTVIFVHGCFWHQHESCNRAYMPSSRKEIWQNKFANNKRRDVRVIQELGELGWRVIVIWECGLAKSSTATSLDWLPAKIKQSEEPFLEWPCTPTKHP